MDNENLVDYQIEAKIVRLVNNDGTFAGEHRIESAISIAEHQGLNLVQVTDHEIPVCKIVNFGKFLYEQKKKQKNEQKSVTKEVKFRPNIGENDIRVKIRKIQDFLKKKNKVKITITFKGREVQHTEIGFDLANRIIEETSCSVINTPTLENNNIHVLLELEK